MGNYFGMTLGTLSISLLPWVQAKGDSSSLGKLPENPSMFSSGGLYFLMGALIFDNILHIITPAWDAIELWEL